MAHTANILMHRPLSETDILPAEALRRLGSRVLCFDELESTNQYLKQNADGLPDGTVVTAEFQSGGRGRHGRAWDAPRGSSILLSVLLIEPMRSPLVTHAATLACLSACEAVREATDLEPRVRWPNDLTLAGRKLAGALAETTPLSEDRQALVLGVGINCLQHRRHFAGELREKATSLEIESPRPVERMAVAQRLVARLDEHFGGMRSEDDCSEAAAATWTDLCDDIGRRVVVQHHGRRYRGTIVDISRAGDLVLQLDTGGREQFGAATTTRIW